MNSVYVGVLSLRLTVELSLLKRYFQKLVGIGLEVEGKIIFRWGREQFSSATKKTSCEDLRVLVDPALLCVCVCLFRALALFRVHIKLVFN